MSEKNKCNYVIGIDLGGTKIKGALADLDGRILSSYTVPTNAFEGEEAVLGRINGVIGKVLEEADKSVNDIKAIGIGSPGPLDSKNGIIINSANLPFKNFNIVKEVKKVYDLPVYLENDANVAAIAEYMFGAGKGTRNMVYVTVSTGVGGGAVLNGKLYKGSTSNALEIGHTTVLPDGPKCNCGNYGCVEVLTSGTAIARQAREAIESGLETSLSQYDKVTSYEVYVEAQKGDKVSKDILEKSFTYLGIGIANTIVSFDPEMIVIGGGVSKMGSVMFDKVNEVVKERALKAMVESCKIVPAGLGEDTGVMGAVALAITEDE
ncbi:MAG: ROK family protein [Clostridiales bacterium]|uniref:ROK family protein n=1 Tax=Clostridium sp. N3C TaxID=1776758 RepID=UPI00092DEEF9|nr:ROK family protein [Clostridium sp. N3C]NLZ47671.1 ROK family protein [Clostridiales bacterium]SCN22865.1 Glucokinase [Clostridium sp. N3C]